MSENTKTPRLERILEAAGLEINGKNVSPILAASSAQDVWADCYDITEETLDIVKKDPRLDEDQPAFVALEQMALAFKKRRDSVRKAIRELVVEELPELEEGDFMVAVEIEGGEVRILAVTRENFNAASELLETEEAASHATTH